MADLAKQLELATKDQRGILHTVNFVLQRPLVLRESLCGIDGTLKTSQMKKAKNEHKSCDVILFLRVMPSVIHNFNHNFP